MSEPLTFTTQMSFDDFLAANRSVLLRAWNFKAIAIALLRMAVIIVVLLVIFALIAGEDPLALLAEVPMALLIGGTAFLAVCFIVQWFSIPKAARKTFDQLGTVDLPTTYKLTKEQFESSFPQGNSWHPWSQFIDFIETDRLIMIRRTPWLFFGIPKAQLDQQTNQELVALLNATGLKRT